MASEPLGRNGRLNPLGYHRWEVTLEASYHKLQLSSKTKVSDRILVIVAGDLEPQVCHSINNNKAQLSLTNPQNVSALSVARLIEQQRGLYYVVRFVADDLHDLRPSAII